MLFFGFESGRLKKSCILQEENFVVIGAWCYGNSTLRGECQPVLGGSLQVGIRLAAIFGCQQNPSDPHFWPTGRKLFWSRKQHSVDDYPFRGGTHTRHFSVGFLPVTSERILTISLLCFILEGGKMQQRNSCSQVKKEFSVQCRCAESPQNSCVIDFFLPSHSATKLQKKNL